ncbi:hypothetical protein, partial [Streptomyces sp. NPDC006668]|uniref:hypothetical protein n=1 Tax=Streptomyces sp. NPDC006668 TaxID=3156903 RepID=UPI0033D086C5
HDHGGRSSARGAPAIALTSTDRLTIKNYSCRVGRNSVRVTIPRILVTVANEETWPDAAEWTGKIYSGGWRQSEGGVQRVNEPATG